jgi:hypothetical protein
MLGTGRLVSDRLLLGSPLRRPRVAGWVVAGLLAAIVVSVLTLLLAVQSLKPGAAGVFVRGLGLAALASLVPVSVLWFLDRCERSRLSSSRWPSCGARSSGLGWPCP